MVCASICVCTGTGWLQVVCVCECVCVCVCKFVVWVVFGMRDVDVDVLDGVGERN